MALVYLALGSNIGDSKQYLAQAIELLGSAVTDIVSASLYVSRATGYTNQPDFLNTVIKGHTQLTPQELLNFIKQIEATIGRIHRFRWGPREIDIDIVFYGQKIINKADLTIPHPRFRERDFVLRPLADLDPQFIDPLSKMSVRTLLKRLPAAQHSILDRDGRNALERLNV